MSPTPGVFVAAATTLVLTRGSCTVKTSFFPLFGAPASEHPLSQSQFREFEAVTIERFREVEAVVGHLQETADAAKKS